MKATCVVPTYQRHANIPRIIDSLLQTPEIAEVVIWNNNYPANATLLSEIISRYRTDPVHMCVDAEQRNLFTYGRYKGAMQAQCGVICTQDDDVLVTPEKWRRLFDVYESLAERRLCCYLDAGHVRHMNNGKYEHAYTHGTDTCKVWEMLVGWGAVFERDWVREIFNEYLAMQPFDELSLRKADRIFTVMLEAAHVVVQDERVEHLPGSHSADAVYRRPDHWQQNKAAVDRALWVLRTRP